MAQSRGSWSLRPEGTHSPSGKLLSLSGRCGLEEVGCKVGIGVATDADKAFIGNLDGLDVEPDREIEILSAA